MAEELYSLWTDKNEKVCESEREGTKEMIYEQCTDVKDGKKKNEKREGGKKIIESRMRDWKREESHRNYEQIRMKKIRLNEKERGTEWKKSHKNSKNIRKIERERTSTWVLLKYKTKGKI